MIINETIPAGGMLEYTEEADFFRILAAGGTLDVIFYRQGREVARAEQIGAGYSEQFTHAFDKIRITSAAQNTFSLALRLGNTITYDMPPNGAVNGSFNQIIKTVTPTSAQILPANSARRYLLIQNRSPDKEAFISLNGANALSNGLCIEAGGSIELSGFVPVGAVTAAAQDNLNVVIVEG